METLKKSSSVLFATFSPYINGKRDPKNGNIDPMISFFVSRVNNFTLIDQPHTGSDIVAPIIEEYRNGKLNRKYSLINILYKPFYALLKSIKLTDDDTNFLFKIRDIVSVLHIGLKSKTKINFFVGLESINALAGIILKKLGKIDRVIYYVSDYSPFRYSNKLFNWIYLSLDRFCCYNADYIWDVSKAMHPARIKAGLDKERSALVIHVPNALFPKYIKHLPMDKIIPFSLVFMGSLGFENGPDLAMEIVPFLVKKYPKLMLYVIGGGQKDLSRLKNLADSLRINKYVRFYGMIPKDEDMFAILRQFSIALAPYRKIEGSVRWYGDSLKLRAYMASGLPVITTGVPPLGKELESFGSAIVSKDDKKHLIASVEKLISDKKFYDKCRVKAILYGKSNTWDNSFINAFKKMSIRK